MNNILLYLYFLCFKVYIFSDMSVLTPAFLSFTFSWNIIFHIHFQSMCVLCPKVGLFQVAYYPVCLFMSFDWSIQSTDRIIIDTYAFIAILNLAFQLIFCIFFVPLCVCVCVCVCGLMISFYHMPVSSSFWFLWI